MPPGDVELLAFLLPQFHRIDENDEWWGLGFTEWTNVRRAAPNFPGHDQPHVPADLGYYDLLDPDVRLRQAALARAHGITGFCYYYYWFEGRRLLEQPLDAVLASGSPSFPFCVFWANEDWKRTWDGGRNEILVAQRYSEADDRAFIRTLLPAFRDPRYIRVLGQPLLLVYRCDTLPDAIRTFDTWRALCIEAGEISRRKQWRCPKRIVRYSPPPSITAAIGSSLATARTSGRTTANSYTGCALSRQRCWQRNC